MSYSPTYSDDLDTQNERVSLLLYLRRANVATGPSPRENGQCCYKQADAIFDLCCCRHQSMSVDSFYSCC